MGRTQLIAVSLGAHVALGPGPGRDPAARSTREVIAITRGRDEEGRPPPHVDPPPPAPDKQPAPRPARAKSAPAPAEGRRPPRRRRTRRRRVARRAAGLRPRALGRRRPGLAIASRGGGRRRRRRRLDGRGAEGAVARAAQRRVTAPTRRRSRSSCRGPAPRTPTRREPRASRARSASRSPSTSRGAWSSVRVLQGLGYGLDESALAAARALTFEPATRCGKPSPRRSRSASTSRRDALNRRLLLRPASRPRLLAVAARRACLGASARSGAGAAAGSAPARAPHKLTRPPQARDASSRRLIPRARRRRGARRRRPADRDRRDGRRSTGRRRAVGRRRRSTRRRRRRRSSSSSSRPRSTASPPPSASSTGTSSCSARRRRRPPLRRAGARPAHQEAARRRERRRSRAAAPATTDADGHFHLDDVAPGEHVVTLSGPHLTALQTTETFEAGQAARRHLRRRAAGREGARGRGPGRPRDRRHRAAHREAGRLDRGVRRAGAPRPRHAGRRPQGGREPARRRSRVDRLGPARRLGRGPAGHARLRRRRAAAAPLSRRRVPLGRPLGLREVGRARARRVRRRVRARPRRTRHRAAQARREGGHPRERHADLLDASADVRARLSDRVVVAVAGRKSYLDALLPVFTTRNVGAVRPHPALLRRAGARRRRPLAARDARDRRLALVGRGRRHRAERRPDEPADADARRALPARLAPLEEADRRRRRAHSRPLVRHRLRPARRPVRHRAHEPAGRLDGRERARHLAKAPRAAGSPSPPAPTRSSRRAASAARGRTRRRRARATCSSSGRRRRTSSPTTTGRRSPPAPRPSSTADFALAGDTLHVVPGLRVEPYLLTASRPRARVRDHAARRPLPGVDRDRAAPLGALEPGAGAHLEGRLGHLPPAPGAGGSVRGLRRPHARPRVGRAPPRRASPWERPTSCRSR